MSDGQSGASDSSGMIDRRDRLEQPMCADEPTPFPEYQEVLNQAYDLRERGKISQVFALLAAAAHLPMTQYQEVRTAFLLGEYYKAQDQVKEPAQQSGPNPTANQDFLGEAADHYARGADIARGIPDLAVVAQLKQLESEVCYFSDPRRKRLERAFLAAKEALETWRRLPVRMHTTDMTYGFRLGDALGIYGQAVAQDGDAVGGLEYAAQKLFDLHDRPDRDVQRYANDELFLDWDWTHLYYTMAHYRQAFQAALRTRRKGRDLFTTQNRARFQWLIASIMIECAEAGGVGDHSFGRLMAASDYALDEGYVWIEKGKEEEGKEDRATYAMLLLAEARWMGMSKYPRYTPEDRIAKIEEAQRIATERDDILLLGQVETAWGDEYAFQYAAHPPAAGKEVAAEHYRTAIAMLEGVEAFSLARIARRRLERL